MDRVQAVLDAASTTIDQELQTKKYVHIKGLLTGDQCAQMCVEVESLVTKWYTHDNIWNHSAYISDDAKGLCPCAFNSQKEENRGRLLLKTHNAQHTSRP